MTLNNNELIRNVLSRYVLTLPGKVKEYIALDGNEIGIKPTSNISFIIKSPHIEVDDKNLLVMKVTSKNQFYIPQVLRGTFKINDAVKFILKEDIKEKYVIAEKVGEICFLCQEGLTDKDCIMCGSSKQILITDAVIYDFYKRIMMKSGIYNFKAGVRSENNVISIELERTDNCRLNDDEIEKIINYYHLQLINENKVNK